MSDDLERAQMSAAEINDLPDSAFAYIEPGGSKDDSGKTTPRSLRHFPINDEAHVRNALSRAPQSPFGEKAMPAIRRAAKKFGIDVGGSTSASRSRDYWDRSFPLEGIEILSRAKGGDGRTVEAFAAVFDVPQEVHDQYGHYRERIVGTAFNKTLADGALSRAMCLYNHGMSVVDGKPDSLAQVPLGLPLEIRADRRGLLTVTRYNKTQLADAVLESIRNDDIRAQSFRGTAFRSDPPRVPRVRAGQPLPEVTRMELGLTDYGPTPRPYYKDAAILAVRSAQEVISAIAGLDEDERAELIRMLATTRTAEPGSATATPYLGAGPEEPRDTHSGRMKLLRLRAEAMLQGV
jgi:HK97 family phage prohead protease